MAVERAKQILVVDDEEANRSILEQFLHRLQYKVDLCKDGHEALVRLRDHAYEIIFADVNMPNMTGVDLLQTLREKGDQTPFVMITGFPSITLAVETMKKGATDFLTKPFRLEHIEHIVTRISKEISLHQENLQLAAEVRSKKKIEELNQDLQTNIEELALLYSISDMCQSVEDMEELFDRIVKMASNITHGQEVSIHLLDRETDHLVPKRGFTEDRPMLPIPLGQGIVGKAAQERRAITVSPGRINDHHIPHKTDGTFLSLPMMIKNELFGVLNISKPSPEHLFSHREIQLLEKMVAKCSLTLENHALYEGLYDNLIDTLRSLVMAVEAKDLYTKDHSRRVTNLAILIANKMKLPLSEIEALRFAGFIHDIGKIGIQDTVLLKPGMLTDTEIEIIQTHPIIGENIVKPIKFLKEELAVVRHHHERYDGSGYPDGLMGDGIPLLARILTLADTYDAITSTRPYRKAEGHDIAVAEIMRCRKTQFDPDVTEAFHSISTDKAFTLLFHSPQ